MSKKKITKSVANPAAVEAIQERPSPILPFLEKYSVALAVAFVAVALFRIFSTYSVTFATFDEPTHIACGLQYLAEHVYRYEPQHPPLARAAVALGPFLSGARPLHTVKPEPEGVKLMYQSGRPESFLASARLGVLPFFVLAAVTVYLWTRRYFGGAAAVLSTALFTLVPTVLAHAGVATTDMGLTGCLTAAFFAMLVWAEQPTWLHSVLLGLATGLAAVSKFTALGFFPAAAVFAAITWFFVVRPGTNGATAAAKARALPFVVAVVTGAFVIWAVYLFSFGKPHGWSFSVPGPELFEGVAFASYHNSKGHAAFFFGELRNTGWWYFFPVMFFLKTPLAWLLLVVAGLLFCFRRRMQLAYWMPLAYALGSLIPSMTSRVNIGSRHILPMTAGLAIVAGLGLFRFLEDAPHKKWAAVAAALLPLWLIASGALQHPNYLGYFNELAPTPHDTIVVDSDLDWGQDAIRLGHRLKELGATQVNYSTFTVTPQQLSVWPGLPNVRDINPLRPAEGWTAVSPTLSVVGQYGLNHRYPNIRPWFTYLQPQERVGALLLYYVPPGSLPK
jgi:hypothetical protein